MRYVLMALCLLALVVPASAIELGAGGTYFSENSKMAPMIGVCVPMAQHDAIVTWARDDKMNHTDAQLTMDVTKLQEFAIVYVQGGMGFGWEKWDTWHPELVYGIGLKGPVSKFVGRAGWTRTETGGEFDGTNSFFLSIYIGGD